MFFPGGRVFSPNRNPTVALLYMSGKTREPVEYLDRLHPFNGENESFFRSSALFLQPLVIARKRKAQPV